MNKNGNVNQNLPDKIQAQDEAAFKEFFDKYHKNVFLLCSHMLRETQEAEDVTQEVFLKAFLNMEKFRGESKASTWLHRIAVTLCLNRLRRKKTVR
ncbi:MAG: RNA polymerase sigma factor, partial [Candidatus Aminicenantaceae bacterium]